MSWIQKSHLFLSLSSSWFCSKFKPKPKVSHNTVISCLVLLIGSRLTSKGQSKKSTGRPIKNQIRNMGAGSSTSSLYERSWSFLDDQGIHELTCQHGTHGSMICFCFLSCVGGCLRRRWWMLRPLFVLWHGYCELQMYFRDKRLCFTVARSWRNIRSMAF